VAIKLPENGGIQAIEDIIAMDKESGILSRDIAAVDMRLSDRLAIQLTPEAAVRRNAALTEQMKAAKKAGRNI
jgi:cell division protein FtsQ